MAWVQDDDTTAAEPIIVEDNKWQDATTAFEFERVDGVQYRVTKQTRTFTVQRPFGAADLRSRWAKFGEAASGVDYTEKEPTQLLELGSMDPIEKKCRDEVFRMWDELAAVTVTVTDPTLARFAKANASAAASTPTSASPAVEEKPAAESDGKPKTWGQKRDEDRKAKPALSNKEKFKANAIRILNLNEHISLGELQTLFGPEGGFGKIVNIFIAKDAQGNYRGFAYITYEQEEVARKVVEKMKRVPFKNTILTVDWATEQKK